ncbi:MAG TPA: ATP-binding protein [Alphaproteobacteria bacterium]|jgi:two-component system cell cycle sensor histidine kinase/response regulator CckA
MSREPDHIPADQIAADQIPADQIPARGGAPVAPDANQPLPSGRARPWQRPALWGGLALLFLVSAGLMYSIGQLRQAQDDTGPLAEFLLSLATGLAVCAVPAILAYTYFVRQRHSLVAQNRLLVGTLDADPHGRAITAPNGRVVYGNPAFTHMFAGSGMGAARAFEQRLTAGGEIGRQMSLLRGIAASGGVGHAELRMGGPLGTVGQALGAPPPEAEWRSVSAYPVKDHEGYVLWRIEDITSRRQMEQVLREEREKLVDFLENASAGFYSVDEEGRFLYVNQTLAGWLGAAPDEILKGDQRLHDFIAGVRAKGAPPYDPFGGPAAGTSGEVSFRARDGRLFQAAVSQTIKEDRESGQLRTRAIVRDLTAERELEQVLRISEQRFHRLFEDAPIGIAILDLDGRVSDCNRMFRDMVGRPAFRSVRAAEPPAPADGARNGIIGTALADFISAEDRQTLGARLSEVASGGAAAAAPFDVRFPYADRLRVATLYVSRLEDAAGRLSGLMLHFFDATQQRQLEVQFAQSQKMQAVGQLAGGVAHDFNNLLTVMIGFCDLLLLRHRPGEQTFADIMQIKQNANRAANLVRQLLAFSRQQTLQPKILDITDILAELSNLLRRLIGVNIQLKVVHGRDLGLVRVDQGQFEQVIINLVVNARDAMSGGGTLTIRTANVVLDHEIQRGVEIMPAGDYVQVEVIDTGCGIPPENIERIFEPFFSTKEVGSGTGLGLSTVYGIVKQTGGFVMVDSVAGEGSTFSIYLPRHHATSAERVVSHDDDASAGSARDLTGVGTILLVEDEDAVRLFGARALRNKGYKVLEAKNGENALEVIKDAPDPVDLVITDVVMPVLDGPELVRRVRTANPTMKVIFISGYAEDNLREKLAQSPDVHFLPKPFSLQQLAGKVKEVLAG